MHDPLSSSYEERDPKHAAKLIRMVARIHSRLSGAPSAHATVWTHRDAAEEETGRIWIEDYAEMLAFSGLPK